MDGGTEGEDYTKAGNTATITAVNGEAGDLIRIGWVPGDEEGCTIKFHDVNSPNRTITPKIAIIGGNVNDGNATSNTVDISNVKFEGSAYIYGGCFGRPDIPGIPVYYSGRTSSIGDVTGNTVEIKGTTFKKASEIYGGYTSGDGDVTGNKVTIEDTMFEKHSFISGGRSDSGEANENRVIINGGTFSGGTSVNSHLDSHVSGGYSFHTANYNKVIISGGTFNCYVSGGVGANAAVGNSVIISGDGIFYREVRGGNSGSGTVKDNRVSISGGTFVGNVCGGWGKGWSIQEISSNSVIISGGTFNDIYGGYIQSIYGTANDNIVILVGKDATYPVNAEQTLTGSGNITINGTVYGGYVENGTPSGNEIHVYGSDINVGNIKNFDELHFFIDDQMRFGETMLTINGVNNDPNVYIPNGKLAVTVSGKPKPSVDNNTDNTITLVDCLNGTIGGFVNGEPVDVKIGATLSGNGSVALTDDEKKLVLTLNVEVNENGKSLVETRAAAAFVVNNMSDFMLGTGMEQAKAAAGGVTPIDAGTMAPFAAVGGSNMRYTTGSYVDVNGWNGAVGFAKQADKLLFGVAVEHGRGNYDSYLDNGVHASGDIKSTGGVIFGEYKLDNGVHYDAALRAGRVKSDYNSTATSYDESSTYYGFSLGGGKELAVSDKATLDVYGRYYFSHTNGSDVSIATGEEIDFDAVNSHRLRIGGRYTTTLTEKSKAYAGLAWQYEFGGDAKAAINGYSAPTPSLQGHSAIVEAGYKLNAGKNLTLDFNLNGAMGKQRGIGGGIGAQWLF
ncbi:MAG: autotransporter outer membrane beta-barrel domain-containing protein [Phascolarctobacterium sp.]